MMPAEHFPRRESPSSLSQGCEYPVSRNQKMIDLHNQAESQVPAQRALGSYSSLPIR
jgi:hypothetical protein